MEYKLSPQPDYGELMTIECFKDMVESGCFIDDDGHGSLATKDQNSDIIICPSDMISLDISDVFTHVIWYNR